MDFPCSYGEGDLDRNVTRSGIHVVTEKYEDFYMTNPAAGYANVHERFAVRISNNGEFIHANPASSGAQGNTNVTNGCINLSTDDAQQYFNSAIYGDPVEVTGTRDRPVLRRRRHLGLGGVMGRLGVDVGVVAPNPDHRRSRAPRRRRHGCADAVGHAESTTRERPWRVTVRLNRTARLVPRPDHDQVQVDV